MSEVHYCSHLVCDLRATILFVACLLGVAVDECHAAAQTSLPQICETRIAPPVSRVLANYPDFSHAPLLSGIIASSTQRLPSAVSSTGPLPFTPASEEIEGIASMYNPSEPDDEDPGGQETASGEKYDPEIWSAAIRIDLRNKFGGIGFGTKYQPSYALIESKDKRAIVKINDVGPLKPDRIIDLNIRAMHYFDPSLGLGLIDVKVIPLIGSGIMPGPLETNPSTNFAGWFT